MEAPLGASYRRHLYSYVQVGIWKQPRGVRDERTLVRMRTAFSFAQRRRASRFPFHLLHLPPLDGDTDVPSRARTPARPPARPVSKSVMMGWRWVVLVLVLMLVWCWCGGGWW